MTEPKMLWEILVPTVRNNGKPFRKRYHKVWDAKVREISGGVTIMPVGKGEWVSPDKKLFCERMIPVRIMATYSEMVKIADLTIKYYEQLAVMYYVVSMSVVIQHKDAS